jgi:hypothetical protein
VGAVSLAVIAVFSGLDYFDAAAHRANIERHQKAAESWTCWDSNLQATGLFQDQPGADRDALTEIVVQGCEAAFGEGTWIFSEPASR